MKCMIVVLAVASLCLAEPEADPLYAPFASPYFSRPYYASGYAGPLPGASFQSVHRIHKREADPQLLQPVVQGPVAGPLTAAFGDLVSTNRGLRPISLEGFSEDVNQDGFVDPVAQAVPAPVVSAPLVAAPAFASPVIRTVAAPAPVVHTVAAPAPFVRTVAAPLAAPVVRTVAAPIAAPVVRTVAAAAPVALTPHDCVTPHGCSVKAALLAGTQTGSFGHVTSTIVKREAEAEAEAEADADAFYYGNYGYNAYPYASYAPYAAPYAAAPYAYNPFGYNYFGGYAGYPYSYPYAAPVAPVAPVVEAAPVAEVHAAPLVEASPVVPAPAPVVRTVAAPAPVVAAPLVKTITKPVTYTHIGAHPVNPTTVLETETYV